jgi:hypothetical protein
MQKQFLVLAVILFTWLLRVQSQDVHAFNEYYRKSIDKVQDLAKNKRSYFDCDTSIRQNYAELVFEMLKGYGSESDSVAILFYFIKDDSLSVWLAKKNKLYQVTIPATRDKLLKIESELRSSLKVETFTLSRLPDRGGEVILEITGTTAETAIRNATEVLLPSEISSQLQGLMHLIIIPEFNIGRIPFYVLKPFNSTEYLVDRMSVSFAPHLCNLAGFRNNYGYVFGKPNKVSTKDALVVGNPVYKTGLQYAFKSLPGAEAEANEVAAIFGTKALTGIDAKKSEVVNRAHSADLIYFATHGVFNMETVLEGSFLAFTPDSENSDGLLTAKEIQDYHLRARLAVLSACQTGIGKIYEGGFFGIGRTFFIAGVANTVTSLWSVNDEATRQLMTMFAKELTQEDYFYPSQHLRKAILKYKLSGNKNAADWSAFMVFGYSF